MPTSLPPVSVDKRSMRATVSGRLASCKEVGDRKRKRWWVLVWVCVEGRGRARSWVERVVSVGRVGGC